MDVHGGGPGQLTSYYAVLPCGPVWRIKSGHTTFRHNCALSARISEMGNSDISWSDFPLLFLSINHNPMICWNFPTVAQHVVACVATTILGQTTSQAPDSVAIFGAS